MLFTFSKIDLDVVSSYGQYIARRWRYLVMKL